MRYNLGTSTASCTTHVHYSSRGGHGQVAATVARHSNATSGSSDRARASSRVRHRLGECGSGRGRDRRRDVRGRRRTREGSGGGRDDGRTWLRGGHGDGLGRDLTLPEEVSTACKCNVGVSKWAAARKKLQRTCILGLDGRARDEKEGGERGDLRVHHYWEGMGDEWKLGCRVREETLLRILQNRF